MMVNLFTAAILALMLSFGNSTSCNNALSVNSDYPVVDLEAICSETAITVTYEAQDTNDEFTNLYFRMEYVGYDCRNTTGSLVDKGSVYGVVRQEASYTEVISTTFPVGTHCTFIGCYSYTFGHFKYSFQEISCTILGPGYECSDDADCSQNAMCIFIDEETECECTGGYEKSGTSCKNINECTLETHQCGGNTTCSDTEGGYNCTCISGYEGDGINCTNIDECTLEMHQCGNNATCSDTEGGYSCTCISGYEGDGIICTNIDECALETHQCDDNATCSDTKGGYNCTCISGYEGDGVNCTDIDECAQTESCHTDAICMNTEGGYNCACMQGYEGNGISCTALLAEDNMKYGTYISIAYGFGGIVLALSACVVVFTFYLVRKRRKQSYRSDPRNIFSDIWQQPVDEKFFPVEPDYVTSPTLPKSFDGESFFNELEYTSDSIELQPLNHEEIADSGIALTQYDLDTRDSGISNLSDDYNAHADTHYVEPALSTEPQSLSKDGLSPVVQDASFENCNDELLSHEDAEYAWPCELSQLSKDSCNSSHCSAEDRSCSQNKNSEIDVVKDTSSTYDHEDLFWQEEFCRLESVYEKEQTESADERGYIN